MTTEDRLNLYRMIYDNFTNICSSFWINKNNNEPFDFHRKDYQYIIFDTEANKEYKINDIGLLSSLNYKELKYFFCSSISNKNNDENENEIVVNKLIYNNKNVIDIDHGLGLNIDKSYIIKSANNKDVIIIKDFNECKTAIIYDNIKEKVDNIIIGANIAFKDNDKDWFFEISNEDQVKCIILPVEFKEVLRVFKLCDTECSEEYN